MNGLLLQGIRSSGSLNVCFGDVDWFRIAKRSENSVFVRCT